MRQITVLSGASNRVTSRPTVLGIGIRYFQEPLEHLYATLKELFWAMQVVQEIIHIVEGLN
jgi:hypothetical protein